MLERASLPAGSARERGFGGVAFEPPAVPLPVHVTSPTSAVLAPAMRRESLRAMLPPGRCYAAGICDSIQRSRTGPLSKEQISA